MPTRSFSVNTGVQSQKINTQEQMIEEYKEAERKKNIYSKHAEDSKGNEGQ